MLARTVSVHSVARSFFDIDPVEMIAGDLPRRQRRLVEAWAELHQSELQQSELMEDWNRLQSGMAPEPIEPLK